MARLPDGSEVRVLLLDLDDTLLDTRSGVAPAWDHIAALLAEGRPELDPAAVRNGIDRVTDWFWRDPERHRTGRLDLVAARRTILGRVLADLGVDDPPLVERAAVAYERHRRSTQRLEEGVLDVLAELRRRVGRLGLVTNGASGAQRDKIERFGLERFFDHVQVEGEVGVGKPERGAYEHALGALDAEPATALMVGDNFECDVLGSLEAGLHAAWIDARRRGRPPAPAPRPFHTLPSVHALLSLLAR